MVRASPLTAQWRRRDPSLAPDLGNQEREVIDVAPGPLLARLERADQRVTALVRVGGGMAVGRVVAAPDLSALEADPQMQPRVAHGQTLLTALDGLGQLLDLDLI